MKKLICIMIAAIMLLFALPAGATELGSESESFIDSVVESEEISAEESSEIVFPESETAVETEAVIVIDESMSWSEVVFAIAEVCGISVEEAEKMVGNIRIVGDKYFGESDLWAQVVTDMDAHPAKWTLIGMLIALILFLVGLLVKRVISDATAMAKLKVAVSNIDAALNGDERDSKGNALSIRAMINEKNGHIELLEKENVELKTKAEELAQVVESLNKAIGKIEANSDTSLKLTEESTLQILQLLNIALDRKVPITTKEAREIWYSATQNKIKSIYEEGVANGNDGNAEKA